MAISDRIGATGDSQRIRNNDWFVFRSANGRQDINVFKVDTNNDIIFFNVPKIGSDELALKSQVTALELRVATLESIVGGVSAGNTNIVPVTITLAMISAKGVGLPQTPISGSIVMFTPNGIPLLSESDFSVVGNFLSWDGFELESQIEEGTILKIVYMF